jgi:hypothetical protein
LNRKENVLRHVNNITNYLELDAIVHAHRLKAI